MILLSRILGNQRGNITLLFALILPLLVGFIGTGAEVNAWYRQKSDLQKAADAAAIATGNALDPNACGQSFSPQALDCLQSVATASVSANGFGPRPGGQQLYGGVAVVAPFARQNNQVQVCVSLTESRLFSAISEGNGTVTLNTCAAARYKSASGAAPLNAYATNFHDYDFGFLYSTDQTSAPTLNVIGGSSVAARIDQGDFGVNFYNADNSLSASQIYTTGNIIGPGTVTGTKHLNLRALPTINDPFTASTINGAPLPPNTNDPFGTAAPDNLTAPTIPTGLTPGPTPHGTFQGSPAYVLPGPDCMALPSGGTWTGGTCYFGIPGTIYTKQIVVYPNTTQGASSTPVIQVVFDPGTESSPIVYSGPSVWMWIYNNSNVVLGGDSNATSSTTNFATYYTQSVYLLRFDQNTPGGATLLVKPGAVMTGAFGNPAIQSIGGTAGTPEIQTIQNIITVNPGIYYEINLWGNEVFTMIPPSSNKYPPSGTALQYLLYNNAVGLYIGSSTYNGGSALPGVYKLSPGTYSDIQIHTPLVNPIGFYPGVYIAGWTSGGNDEFSLNDGVPTAGGSVPGASLQQLDIYGSPSNTIAGVADSGSNSAGNDIPGITMFLNGYFDVVNPAKVTFSAPTSGPYNGLLFYARPSSNGSLMELNLLAPGYTPQPWDLEGTIYMPDWAFTTGGFNSGSVTSNLCLQIVANYFNIYSGTMNLENIADSTCAAKYPSWTAPGTNTQITIDTAGGSILIQ